MRTCVKIIAVAAAAALFSLASAFLYGHSAFVHDFLSSVTLCPFRRLTGYPCATCGLTRGVLALGSGQWTAALRVSPLAFLLFLYTAAVASVNLFFAASGRSRHFLWPWRVRPKTALLLALGLLAASWTYNILSHALSK